MATTFLDWLVRRATRPQVVAAAVFAVCGALLHFRGKARLAPARQAGDHSVLTAPYNLLVYAASRAPNGPYPPLEAFRELRPILENWREIRAEGLALRRAGGIVSATGANDIGFHTFFKRGWTRFYLCWYGATPASARAACPRTCGLVEATPAIRGAMFASLPAGA